MIDFTKYPLPKRMRHHTSPNVYLPATELKMLPDGYPELIEKLDWSEHFANSKPPTVLDIGCGRAKFLFELSEREIEENLLGIEVRPAPVEWLRNILDNENIPNMSVLRYSVANGLPFIADSSIKKAFYLFPDPWQKKKHVKRRAFNIAFLDEIFRILKDDGRLHLATDVEEIHLYHLETLSEFAKFDVKLVENDSEWDFPVTNKEKFCRLKDIPFYRLICSKK